MSMNKVPSLIVGIGGIGCRIAAGISDMLSEEDREYVGIVGMDTNVSDLKKMDDHRVQTVQTSDERKVIDFLREVPEYLAWFPVERFTIDQGMLNGAAQIRAISRLAAIAAEESGKFAPIKEEINRIRYHHDKYSNNLTVMIVGSITGGTGAGLFLQLPFYIRKLMKEDTGLDNVIIRGMFVGPDLTVDVQPSDINKQAVRVNAYACLKELNALYLTQTRDNNNLEIDYYEHRNIHEENIREEQIWDKISSEREEYADELDQFLHEINEEDAKMASQNSANIPYNYLYLIEGTTGQSSVGNVKLEEIEQQVSKMVFTLLFTPVVDNALSVEDNMLLQDMQNNGMGRYSGAGLHRLVYPNELAKEYVTLAVTRDLVKEEWLLLEQMYEDEVRDARDRQRTDAMVEIPRMQDTYVKDFKALTEKGELGKYNNEAFIVENNERVSRAASFMTKITDLVNDVIEGERVSEAKSACKIPENAFASYETASAQVSKIYDAVSEYIKVAKSVVISESSAIANKLFPTSLQSLKTLIKSDEESCIYQWLYKVHPITARFLIYDIMNRCEEKIENLEQDLLGINLQSYQDDDYSGEPGKRGGGPAQAINAMKEKYKSKNPEKGLRKIRSLFFANIDRECNQINAYISSGLELAVLKSISTRLKMLSENYRIFFQSIDDVVKESKKTLERIESQQLPLGQTGVYCSKEALRLMAEEYKQTGISDLPQETKTAVFNSLFRVYTKDYDERNRVRTERQRDIYAAQRKIELADVFQKAIVDTIRTDITKNDKGIVDMDIRQALMKEMELVKNVSKEFDDDYDKIATQYIKEKIEGALRQAAPMLAVDTSSMAHNTETVYLAMNPDFAEFSNGQPDAAATAALYIPQRSVETDFVRATVLIDEEFSPYELVCFKARYKFTIEELVKYRKGTPNEKAYKKRIMKLGTRPDTSLGEEAGKTVVNPHLNRYWHEEGFLPEISAADRKIAHRNLLRAFIYSIGMDSFLLVENDEIVDRNGNPKKVWEFITGRENTIVKSRGKIIGNTYTDLYKALPFNGWIKRRMLLLAEKLKSDVKGHNDIDDLYNDILEDEFVTDLIQPRESREDNDANILDIFIGMRDYMEPDEWNELFDGLIETLWDYLSYLFDKNVKYVNSATVKILNEIKENSILGSKAESDYSTKERRANEQMKSLLVKQYKR